MTDLPISRRLLPACEVHYTAEAALVQHEAARREPSVVRLGPIVFFSTASGDAWMIDVIDGEAACLARAGSPQPVPIQESSAEIGIAWPARHRIEDETFVVIDNDGVTRTYDDYPVALIRRLIAEYPDEYATVRTTALDAKAARQRLRETSRNDPCPCGSGRKYKKCCLSLDEAFSASRGGESVQRAELDLESPASDECYEAEDDDWEDVANEASLSGRSANESKPEVDEPEADPEIRAAADRIWDEFDRVANPGAREIDTLIDRLLALPPEATDWADVFRFVAQQHHPDLPAVFRRIAAVIPRNEAAGAPYFYWSAIENFVPNGQTDLVPEIASGFCTLDRASYDADALTHIVYWAMAAGCDTDALAMEEHFLPIMRGDTNLMPHVVPSVCRSIFELRVGLGLRELGKASGEVEALTKALHRGLDDEIPIAYARLAAQRIAGDGAFGQFQRTDLDLVLSEETEEKDFGSAISDRAQRHFDLLMCIAHEAWQYRDRSPGSAFLGLRLLVDAIFGEREDQRGRKKSSPKNLLDCLRPSGMERRIALGARDMLDVNTPHAHLLIEAHADLLHFAIRYRLIGETEAEKSKGNIAMLRKRLGFPVPSGTTGHG